MRRTEKRNEIAIRCTPILPQRFPTNYGPNWSKSSTKSRDVDDAYSQHSSPHSLLTTPCLLARPSRKELFLSARQHCPMNIGRGEIMVWDWILFVAVVALCILVVLRPLKKVTRGYRFAGLLWFRNHASYWGPCCEACLIQYTLRPAFRSPDGTQYYELVCPVCLEALAGRAFTLQALMEAEARLAATVKLGRAGIPLAANHSLPLSTGQHLVQ